jgi:DNA-binding Lrp family transcriptional regulator
MIATAYILIKVEAGKARKVYDELNRLEGAQRVEAIIGPCDIIVTLQGTDFNAIGATVMDKIRAIPGVIETITCNVIHFQP